MLSKKTLLKHLTKSDKEDIIREVVVLFDKFKNVKEFYNAELSGEGNPLLKKYKKKIEDAYAKPNPKERTTNINLNKLITEFKKISIYDRELCDLMLYRVECGLEAIKRDNKRSSTFYNCIVASFQEAVKLAVADNSIGEFELRISSIVKQSKSGKFELNDRMTGIINNYSKHNETNSHTNTSNRF